MCALFPEQRRHLPICELQDTWCRHSRVGVSAWTAPTAVLSTPVPSAILPREPGCARKWHYGPMLFLLASWILHIFRDPEERGWGESCKYTPRQHKLRISQFPVKSLFLWKLIHVFIRCVTAGSTSSILLCSWRPALPWSPLNESRQDSHFHHRAVLCSVVSERLNEVQMAALQFTEMKTPDREVAGTLWAIMELQIILCSLALLMLNRF